MKLLVTWIGFNEDFQNFGQNVRFNEHGFTASIHKDIFESNHFDKHVILTTTDEAKSIEQELNTRKEQIVKNFKKIYPKHSFEFVNIIDKSNLQNFQMIESSFRSYLLSLPPDMDITVIAGTGPTAVAMAWYSLQMAEVREFRLCLLQLPQYSPGGKVSTLVDVQPLKSKLLDNSLRGFHIAKELPTEIYQDEIVRREYDKAYAIASAKELNVLILGETGCGKDRMAEYIIRKSPLNNMQHKAINCASLPDELLYSELFGHVKGAFTGAINNRNGILEDCAGGTLFMDEIGDISPYMQQSLLRALENWQIKKLGANEVIEIKPVRIIAATNQNLYLKCKSGEFRFDLYYRLCSMEIELLPYRARPVELRRKVIQHYLNVLQVKWGRNPEFSSSAMQQLEQYQFPGNFREIFNTLNGMFALGNDKIEVQDLPARLRSNAEDNSEDYDKAMRLHCLKVYERYGYVLSKTCKALNYKNQTQLKKKFEDWGILKE